MRNALGLSADDLGAVFREWNNARLQSYLIEITSEVLAKHDDGASRSLVDAIVDEAEQKGTGRWTAQSALELGVPITAITEAVYARALSARRQLRATAERHFPHPKAPAHESSLSNIEALRDALYAAKIVAYEQ